MLTVTDGRSLAYALGTDLPTALKQLLRQRFDQAAGSAIFLIIPPTQSLAQPEQFLGFSPLSNPIDGSVFGDPHFAPAWEWAEDHGYCYELTFVLSDDGFAHVVFVDRPAGTSSPLIKMCQAEVATYISVRENEAESKG